MANHSTSAARPIRLPIHNHPAAVRSNGPQPEYEFVHSAGSKKAVDADARRTIRSRVMRNYLQEKSGQKQNESFLNSDSTVKASTSLKGRFRLKSREQLEEEERNHRRTRKRRSPIAPAPEDDNPSTSREDTSSTYTNAVVAITNEIIPNQYSDAISVSTARVVQANYTEAQAGQALGDAVAVIPRFLGSRLDPFNSLPVPGGPRLDRLLYFCKSSQSHRWSSMELTGRRQGSLLRQFQRGKPNANMVRLRLLRERPLPCHACNGSNGSLEVQRP